MRVCLITAGYPHRHDPLAGWCRTLVTGLAGYTFELVTLIDSEPPATPAYPVPRNVASVRALTPDLPTARRRPGAARRRPGAAHRSSGAAGRRSGAVREATAPDTAAEATAATELLCRGLLDEHPHAHDLFVEGLRRLAGLAGAARAGAARAGAARAGDAWAGAARAGAERAGAERPGDAWAGDAWAGDAGARDAGVGHAWAGGAVPLDGVPLAEQLLHAWRAGRAAPPVDRLPLPRLSVRDARIAATLLRHLTQALSAPLPPADLLHCVGGTTPLLAALGARWRSGTPLLLTEARAPAARRRPAEERLSPAVRTVLRRYRRSVTTAGYAEAGLIAPMSGYHHAWALRRGALPSRLVTVPAGVDPGGHPADAGTGGGGTDPDAAAFGAGRTDTRHRADDRENRADDRDNEVRAAGDASLVWTGSGGVDGGLAVVLEAFARVLAAAPGTVLQVSGIAEAERQACAERIERSGLGPAVRVLQVSGIAEAERQARAERIERSGPGPAGREPRATAGLPPGDPRDGVVLHVPEPGDPPYPLIEAMMAGWPVVGVDVAGVAETLGEAGVLVPAGDLAGLAAACLALLRCPARRHALGAAARARALAHFTAEKVVRAYDAIYTDLAGPPPETAYDLALAVPAPRSTLPATVRWLAQEER